MILEDIKTSLSALRQHGVVRSLELQLANRAYDDLTPIEIIGNMCAAQFQDNADRAQARLKKAAKFKFDAQPEDIIWDTSRGLEKTVIRGLLTGDWIRRKENLLLTGSSGVGKSWLGCAFGNAAIRAGYSVRYLRINLLLEDMRRADVDGSIPKLRKALASPDLLMLDDFGIAPISEKAKEYLFEILEARCDTGSTMIIGQLAPSEWYAYLGTKHLADAIMDRIVQQAHIMPLKGDSLRKRL
jgi:DNA replication protein DnaC